MKKILLTVMLLLLVNCHSVFAEELWTENTVGLPKTYMESELHIMSNQDEFDERMRDGWDNLASEVDVSDLGINLSNYQEYYEKTKHNSPLYYYVGNKYGISYNEISGEVIKIAPTYTETDITEIENTLAEIEAATDEILFCIDDNMTDFEKVMTVHDYMVLNYQYDTTLENHTITIMTTKTGVCESYTYAFMYLMDRLGIEATYVSSKSMNHAWNLVKLDGEWYHIDLTWDDPTKNKFAQVRHTYALLSSDAIESLESPHSGYDLGDLAADSDLYDNELWHNNVSAIVCIDGISYWVSENNLVNENGEVIYENLDGGDGWWHINSLSGFQGGVYTGLAEHNGKLYFNTDKEIYAYNPHTESLEVIKKETGICGMYTEKNDLRYCEFSILFNDFYDAGRIHLGDAKIGTPHIEDDKVIIKIFHEEGSDDIITFASGGNHCQVGKVTDGGLTEVEFDAEETLTLFFWDSNMRPLRDKEVITIE